MSDHFGNISIQHPASPPMPGPAKEKGSRRRKTKLQQPRPTSKILIWALILSGFFVLYSIIGFWGVPYYISAIFPNNVYEKTGFLFHTDNVKFNPLTFSFSLENSRIISPSENPSDLLIIKRVIGKLAPLPLLRNDLVSRSLIITDLEAHITRKTDGTYNFFPLFRSSKQNDTTEIMGFSDLPFHFSLNNISVSKSKIIFSDMPAKKIHRIENIQLALPTLSNFAFQADNYIRPHFSATINGSPMELSGQAHVGEAGDDQLGTDLSCDIQSLDLPLYFGYLPFDLPLNFTQGKATGKIGLNFSPKGDKGRKLAISFNLKISDTKLSTRDSSLKLTAPIVTLSGTLHPVSKHIHLKTVSLNKPIISSFGKSFLNNLQPLFSGNIKTAESTSPEITPVPTSSTDIDLLVVDEGILQLFKKKDAKKPHTTWNTLQFNLKQYSYGANEKENQKPGLFRLSGEQDGTSSFSWQGEFAAPHLLDGHLNINNILAADLFHYLDIKPFIKSKGVADLKGKFIFALTGNETAYPSLQLENTSISLQNFLIKEGKSAILSAPIVNISNFSSSKEKTNFGNISIRNGTLSLVGSKFPKYFSLFINNKKDKFQLQSIIFEGTGSFSSNGVDGSQLTFPRFLLTAKELDSTKKPKNNISIITETEKGGFLKNQGTITLSPFSGSLKTEFGDLQVETVLPWFSDSPFLASIRGNLSGEGDFTFPQVGFSGKFNLNQASIVVNKSTSIRWKNGSFYNTNFSTRPSHLTIGRAEFETPGFSWSITENDNSPMENFANILPKTSSFNFEKIFVKNGRIDVIDQRMTPVWQGEIKGFTGTITDINSSDTSGKSQFQFTGKLDDSSFKVKAQSSLFAKEQNGSSTFTLTNFPIADFHYQLAPQLDIDTSKGSFGVKLDSHWEDGQLNSSGTITFSDVEPESQLSASSLPLALLTNREHEFNLDFSRTQKPPVSQSILFDSTIARFQKLIVKSSVSPLLLASGNFTDLIGSEFAEFVAGEAKISRKGLKTLALYSALLASNPNIGIEISGSFNQEIDSAALKIQLGAAETERVAAANKRRFKKWPEQKSDYDTTIEEKRKKMALEGKIVEEDIPPEFLLEFIPTQPQQIVVGETILAGLAEKRRGVVLQYFITQPDIDPERVTIMAKDSYPPSDDAPSHGVSIKVLPLGFAQK